LVASEALASGLPLIVPDEGGCADLAQPGYAETWRANDARSASDAILRMIGRDCAKVRSAAAQAALTVRSDRQHVSELLAYYEELRADRAWKVA
jgi:alpha-1,6-mannosyltransferase